MDKTSSMYLYVKLNWDANRFLPAESKDCMNSASYEWNITKRDINLKKWTPNPFSLCWQKISHAKILRTLLPQGGLVTRQNISARSESFH